MRRRVLLLCGVLASLLRWAIYCSRLHKFFYARPEIATPANSFKRVLEGIALEKAGHSPYAGEAFHEVPAVLWLLNWILEVAYYAHMHSNASKPDQFDDDAPRITPVCSTKPSALEAAHILLNILANTDASPIPFEYQPVETFAMFVSSVTYPVQYGHDKNDMPIVDANPNFHWGTQTKGQAGRSTTTAVGVSKQGDIWKLGGKLDKDDLAFEEHMIFNVVYKYYTFTAAPNSFIRATWHIMDVDRNIPVLPVFLVSIGFREGITPRQFLWAPQPQGTTRLRMARIKVEATVSLENLAQWPKNNGAMASAAPAGNVEQIKNEQPAKDEPQPERAWRPGLTLFFVLCDLWAALCLGFAAQGMLREAHVQRARNKRNGWKEEEAVAPNDPTRARALITLGYLFNPFSVVSCVTLTTSVLQNTLIATALYYMVQRKLVRTSLCLALAAHQGFYSAVLVIPAAVCFAQPGTDPLKGAKKGEAAAAAAKLVGLFFAFSAALLFGTAAIMGSWEFVGASYGFMLTVPDLTPNVGLFWYFFTEMFEHFRLFFLFVFQLNILVYLAPLAIALRHSPVLLFQQYLMLISVFKPYPSVGDAVLYLAFLPAWAHLYHSVRHGLMVGCAVAVSAVLAPVMWFLWIHAGSANANFYFAVTLTYSSSQTAEGKHFYEDCLVAIGNYSAIITAAASAIRPLAPERPWPRDRIRTNTVGFQIFLMTDLLYSHLKHGIVARYGLHPTLHGKEAKIMLEQ